MLYSWKEGIMMFPTRSVCSLMCRLRCTVVLVYRLVIAKIIIIRQMFLLTCLPPGHFVNSV